MTKDGEIVPFGKYKGQPVEQMMADASYCEWALAQPWFRERFAALFAIIVNGGRAPDAETPEHNRMQALLLETMQLGNTWRNIQDTIRMKTLSARRVWVLRLLRNGDDCCDNSRNSRDNRCNHLDALCVLSKKPFHVGNANDCGR